MPRVLQVVLSLNAGGTERLVVELAKRLHAEAPMAVCCLDDEGVWAGELAGAGIDVCALHRGSGFVPRLGHAISQAAARHGATILHCHHYSPFIYGALARVWRPHLRLVYTEHGRLSDAPPSTKRRLANSIFGRLPHAVFTVSGELREHLVQEGFSPAAVGVIYNGIDVGPLPSSVLRMEMRRRLGVDADSIVIGAIARLDPVKDLGTLIRAAARAHSHVPLVVAIIGDGSERAALEQTAQDAGIGAAVRFLGHRNDARDWLAACDLYVNSSISEGVSLTILEAMAAGLPIVATAVGGTPEVLDSTSGILVQARDVEGLATTIVDLGRDDARRHALGAAARRRVETRFTLNRMVAEYLDVYERVND